MLKGFLLSFAFHILILAPYIFEKEKRKLYFPQTVFYIELREIESEAKIIEKKDEKSQVVEKLKEVSQKPKKAKKEKKSEERTHLPLRGGGKAKINLDLPYSYYFEVLLRKISENWHYSYSGNDTLRVTVYFSILKDGSLKDIRIEKTSGDIIFDQQAYRAVYLTKRVPPLPDEFNMEYLRVFLEFEVP
ncbi:MAG: energy transducer TonB [Candidatus Hydrothermales bacterium]